jgi:hypothetical protein
MAKMWQGRTEGLTNQIADELNSSISFDSRMFKEDILGSIAHAKMLCKCGIISETEKEEIVSGLSEILSALKGNWHQITPRKRDFGKYDDEFFNLFCKKNKCYISIDEEKYNRNLIYNIIEFYLKQSSINKICFLIRLNYQKEQKINGVIKYKDFIKKLENKKILFDTTYIIEL